MEIQEGDGKVPKVYKDKAGKRYIYRNRKKVILKVPDSMSKADVIRYVKKHYPISKKRKPKPKKQAKANIKIINKNTLINRGSKPQPQPLTSHPPPNRLDPDVANEISRIRLAKQNQPNAPAPPGNPLPPQNPPVAGAQPQGNAPQGNPPQQPPPDEYYRARHNPYRNYPAYAKPDKYSAIGQIVAQELASREVLGIDDHYAEDAEAFRQYQEQQEERDRLLLQAPVDHDVLIEEEQPKRPPPAVVVREDDAIFKIPAEPVLPPGFESPIKIRTPSSALASLSIPELRELLRKHGDAKGTKGKSQKEIAEIVRERVKAEDIIAFTKEKKGFLKVPAPKKKIVLPTAEERKAGEVAMPPMFKSFEKPDKDKIDERRKELQAKIAEYDLLLPKAKGEAKKEMAKDKIALHREHSRLTTTFNATPKKSPKKGVAGEQVGLGGGLFTNQIVEAMARVPSFIGCVASDQFPQLMARIKPHTRIGFISNLDPSTQGGSHWVAIALNGSDKAPDAHSIMYYDPFGKDIPPNMQKALNPLAEKIDPDNLMKLKISRVQQQNFNTENCGFFSMNFLLNILSRHKSFADATGYKDAIEDKSGKYEKQIEALKNSPPFSFITMKGGSDAETVQAMKEPDPVPPKVAPNAEAKKEAPVPQEKSKVETVANSINDKLETVEKIASLIPPPRDVAPPSFRKFLETHKGDEIVSATVCRKPIFGIIQKTINILRKITFRKANPTFDKLFHLYIYMTLKSPEGKTTNIKMERNQTFEQTVASGAKVGECENIGKFKGKFGEVINKAVKANKLNFWQYDATENNCQDMIMSLLRAGGVATPALTKCIKQDVKGLLPDFITRGAKKVTDIAHGVDRLISGEGAKKKPVAKI
jgi:hypothetical protein